MADPSPPLTSLYAATTIGRARRDGLLWQNTAKTTPATADGDPVRVVTSVHGSVDFVAPSDAARPLLKNKFANVWYLLFDGSDDCLDFSGVAPIPLSIHCVVRWDDGDGTGTMFAGPNNSQKFKAYDVGNFRGGKEGVSNWTASSATLPKLGTYIAGLSYAATGDAYNWQDGVKDTLAQANVDGVSLTGNMTRIGATTSGGEWWNGRLYGFAIYSAGLSDANNLLVHTYLQYAVGGADTADWPAVGDVRSGTNYFNSTYTGTLAPSGPLSLRRGGTIMKM